MILFPSSIAGVLLGTFGVLSIGCQMPVKQPSPAGGTFEILGAPTKLSSPKHRADVGTATAPQWTNYVAARPREELTRPAYPEDALAAGAGICVVYLTVTFDETGQAREIHPSWDKPLPMNDYAESFVAAAKATVASWSVDPAREVHWRRNAEGEEIYIRTDKVSETMEVKFTFDPASPAP